VAQVRQPDVACELGQVDNGSHSSPSFRDTFVFRSFSYIYTERYRISSTSSCTAVDQTHLPVVYFLSISNGLIATELYPQDRTESDRKEPIRNLVQEEVGPSSLLRPSLSALSMAVCLKLFTYSSERRAAPSLACRRRRVWWVHSIAWWRGTLAPSCGQSRRPGCVLRRNVDYNEKATHSVDCGRGRGLCLAKTHACIHAQLGRGAPTQ
jgi:hypothetical protein